MIIKTVLNPFEVTTYHTEGHIKDAEAKIKRIKSRDCYKEVKEDIKINGIKDPVVAISNERRPLMVEVGEQRILIARELGITEINAIIYTKLEQPFKYTRLYNLDDYNDCPGIKMLKRYLKAGIACY